MAVRETATIDAERTADEMKAVGLRAAADGVASASERSCASSGNSEPQRQTVILRGTRRPQEGQPRLNADESKSVTGFLDFSAEPSGIFRSERTLLFV